MNNTPPHRVMLADSDADVRRALALLLQTVLGLQIVGEAADLTGLSASGHTQADLLLIDWANIAPRAAPCVSQLRSLNSALRVIVLSTRPEVRAAALAAGADAFLSKVDPPEQVIATLLRVLSDNPIRE